MVAVHGWAEWDKLIQSSGPLGHILCHLFEVLQGVVGAWGMGDPFAFNVAKGLLRLTKYYPGSREG